VPVAPRIMVHDVQPKEISWRKSQPATPINCLQHQNQPQPPTHYSAPCPWTFARFTNIEHSTRPPLTQDQHPKLLPLLEIYWVENTGDPPFLPYEWVMIPWSLHRIRFDLAQPFPNQLSHACLYRAFSREQGNNTNGPRSPVPTISPWFRIFVFGRSLIIIDCHPLSFYQKLWRFEN